MTLLAPWFLAGLVALAPLVALHLRRRRREQDVASLLLWRDVGRVPGVPTRRSTQFVLPLLLLLQALFLVLLVLALARPGGSGSGRAAGAAPQVFVLDGSARMGTTDVSPDRLAAARREVDARLARLPAGTPVSVVEAGSVPRLLASGVSPRAARTAVARVRADGIADFRAGLALAAGQLHHGGGRITLVRASEDPAPPVQTNGVTFTPVVLGGRTDDQSIDQPVARCAPDATGAQRCSVFATIRNEASSDVREQVTVARDGRTVATRAVAIPAGGQTELAFAADPGSRLTLTLPRHDALPANNTATVVVPSTVPVAVTLVSAEPSSAPLARALSAIPGVTLHVETPAVFARAGARSSTLLVLDHVMPPGAVPAARALLLVDPPRLPGGTVGAPIADPTVSGTDASSPLLAGVDLSGMSIDAGSARGVGLPAALHAIAWSPDGPLLAATDGGPEPTALLSFDPVRSNLAALPAFPILLANVVDWARDGGTTGDAGATNASESAAAVGAAAGSSAASSTPILLNATAGGAAGPAHRTDWWPWLAAAALLVLLAEWSYPLLAQRRSREAVRR